MNITSKITSLNFNKRLISGTVILFNSEEKVIENIQTYLTQINHLFVIDNSEEINLQLIEKIISLPNTSYLSLGKNKGIAYALNIAAELAIKADYQYLLTMDDDTSMPENGIQDMLIQVSQYDLGKCGIIGAQSDLKKISNSVTFVPYTITSGNLLNLEAFQQCGPFMEPLFIDFVDIEYCFRLAKNNFKIVEVNNIKLVHRLGTNKELTLLFNNLKINWASHSPSRVYYKIRNCIYVMRIYNRNLPISIKLYFLKDILREIFNIVFLEDDKFQRTRFLIKALVDSVSGRLGVITS